MNNIKRLFARLHAKFRSAAPSQRVPRIALGAALLLMALPGLFASCEKILDVDYDPSQSQLVVNAVPQAGKRAFVYFAHSRFFLDPSNDQPLDSVALTLYVNGVAYTPDSVSACKYFFPYTYVGGDTLSLDARAGSRRATASTYVPHLPTFSNIELRNHVAGRTFRYYEADFNFQDFPGTDDYYNLRVMVRDSGVRYNEWKQEYDTVDTIHATYFTLRQNPEITGNASYSVPMLGYIYTRNFFNDAEIQGQNYPLHLSILNLPDTNEVPPFKHEYSVVLEAMTYARLRYLIDASRQGSSNSFFSEQGEVRGNVDGALGIFAGSARCEFSFWPDTLVVDSTSSSGGFSLPPSSLGVLRASRR